MLRGLKTDDSQQSTRQEHRQMADRVPNAEESRALELIDKSGILNPDIKMDEVMKLTRQLGQLTPDPGGGAGERKVYDWTCISPFIIYKGTVEIPETKSPK